MLQADIFVAKIDGAIPITILCAKEKRLGNIDLEFFFCGVKCFPVTVPIFKH